MANVNIKFNGRDYLLSCDDGQEDNLKYLASNLDERFSKYSLNDLAIKHSYFTLNKHPDS